MQLSAPPVTGTRARWSRSHYLRECQRVSAIGSNYTYNPSTTKIGESQLGSEWPSTIRNRYSTYRHCRRRFPYDHKRQDSGFASGSREQQVRRVGMMQSESPLHLARLFGIAEATLISSNGTHCNSVFRDNVRSQA